MAGAERLPVPEFLRRSYEQHAQSVGPMLDGKGAEEICATAMQSSMALLTVILDRNERIAVGDSLAELIKMWARSDDTETAAQLQLQEAAGHEMPRA